MMKKTIVLLLAAILLLASFVGCAKSKTLADGKYTCEVTAKDGAVKVESPAKLVVEKGQCYAFVVFDDTNFDFINVGKSKADLRADPDIASALVGQMELKYGYFFPIELDKEIEVTAFMGTERQVFFLNFDGSTVQLRGEGGSKVK